MSQARPPARHGGHHTSPLGLLLLAALVVLVVVAFINVRGVLGNRSTAAAPSSASPANAPAAGSVVDVTVSSGESASDIAQDLQDKGLVANSTLFLGYVKLHGGGTNFQPGVHQVTAGASMDQIATILEQPVQPKQIRVTFPEGRRLEEDAATAAGAGIGQAQDFVNLAQHPDASWNYSFLADKPAKASLEGYLFPDTYLLSADSPTTADLMKRMLDDFDKRLTQDMRDQITASHHTIYQTVIVASLVEREAKVPQDRPLIAGVYWNRLKMGMAMDADPTVQYALGKAGNWWPQLTDQAKNLAPDSPFNTYTHAGLPPGPIANPGLASLQAAVSPQGDYLYFVAKNDGSGASVFAKTLAEQNANVAKYSAGN